MGNNTWADVNTLTVGQTRINIHQAGSGGVTYVLIHGIGTSVRYFEPLAKVLSRHGLVYAVELPGFGAVPKPSNALSIEDFADVVEKALNQLRITHAVVVGHSMGAQVAAALAARSHGVVSAIVLLGPTVNDQRRTVIGQALMLGLDTLRESAAVNWIVFTDYLRAGMPWYLRTVRKMLENRIEVTLAGVRCPIQLVSGGKDPIAPADWLERIRDACPQAVITQLADRPHVLMYKEPEAVARLCLQAAAPR
ncbi:alpha/beta fold hydrolase [Arthrobacter roseus]|uniref:alpha/beta fold hydrolase n=1 Tax=Arthrobacter roseus TaxID=136274 RepID=UPI001964F7D1|nr:alpha/beta hydrolase [Arthrobacter roseus]MBM7849412.1 pimeloyl-ACP methyl ester carboxylesterase [Arthrobacter roseus]